MLNTGITAPDFELYATPDQRLRLSELKGNGLFLPFILPTGARYAETR